MPIMRKIFLSIGTITFGGALYLKKQKVSLKNQYLRSTLSYLHNQNPKYSSWLLKQMIRFQMIGNCQSVKNYVFSYGFDHDAIFIDGLSQIGFDTIQFGPVSLMPSIKQQTRHHFGNKIAIGNINVFCENKIQTQRNNQQLKQAKRPKIGIAITPNYEVLKYAPYLIEENMLSCLKQCQQLNDLTDKLYVDRYVIKLNEPEMTENHSPQYLTMIQSLLKGIHQATQQTLENNKKQFPHQIPTLKKPQIFIQIPRAQQNPQVVKLVKQMPIIQKVIIDGSEYQVSRSTQKVNGKKTENVVQLMIGKKRMNFQQLLDKVVNDTL